MEKYTIMYNDTSVNYVFMINQYLLWNIIDVNYSGECKNTNCKIYNDKFVNHEVLYEVWLITITLQCLLYLSLFYYRYITGRCAELKLKFYTEMLNTVMILISNSSHFSFTFWLLKLNVLIKYVLLRLKKQYYWLI